MEVARLQVAFEATGQPGVQRAIKQTDADIKRLAATSEQAGRRMGSAFDGAGKAIKLAFGAVALIGAGKAAAGFLTINAQAEQLKVQLDIATGSAERATMVFGKLQKMAAETPFEFPELVSAAARIEAFGIDSTKAMNVIGDTAAGTGKSIDQVTNAYLDAGMGQFIRLQELGIDAAVEGDKVKFKWIENGKEITKSVDKNSTEQIQSTLEAIWNRKYEGAMKKQSRTFNGQLSTLKDNWNLTMGRLTMGFFDFTKDVLGEANEFFNLFNRKMDDGLDSVHAALSALHVTLDQVFGKTAGDAIDATLRGIVDGIGAVGAAVAELVGDLARGDFSEFFADLGGIAIDLGTIAIDVAGWALGKVPDLSAWFLRVIHNAVAGGGGSGGGVAGAQAALGGGLAGAFGGPTFTLNQVAIEVLAWAKGKFADLAAWLAEQANAALTEAIKIGPVLIDVTDWTMGELNSVTKADVVNAVKVAWTFDPIEITPEIEIDIHDAFKDWTTDFIANPPDLSDLPDLAPKVALLVAPLLFPLAVPGLVATWVSKNIVPDLAKAIGAALSGVWDAIALNTDIGAKIDEALFGGGRVEISPGGEPFVVQTEGIVDRIVGFFEDLDIPPITLPAWDLVMSAPAKILGGALELNAAVPLWISGAFGAMELTLVKLLSWGIELVTPTFPNLTDNIVVVNWIEDALDALGEFLTSLLEGTFKINVPNPLFPNLTHDFIWNAIQAALTALGDFAFDLPVRIDVIPNINMPNIDLPGIPPLPPIAPPFARGGTVRSPLAMVGEWGPELVSLPRGSYVHTAAQTAAMLRGRRNGGGGGGGNTYYLVDLSNAVVGKGAMQEIQRMIADGSIQTYDGRTASRQMAGR